jgi:hypothetical protein
MPIVRVFDPDGVPRGGWTPGGGGGSSLYQLPPEVINLTDGSWTLYDPDNLVDTITFAGDWHTLTWNALPVGSGDYNWFSGTTIRAPRWYKNLEISGTQVTSMDLLVSTYQMELLPLLDPDVCPFRWLGVFGAALDAASTDTGLMCATGGTMGRFSPTTAAIYGIFTRNTQSSNGPNTGEYGICTTVRGGDGLGGGEFMIFDATGSNLQAAARSAGVYTTGLPVPTDVQLVVGLGTGANTVTITAGDQTKFKLSHVSTTIAAGA